MLRLMWHCSCGLLLSYHVINQQIKRCKKICCKICMAMFENKWEDLDGVFFYIFLFLSSLVDVFFSVASIDGWFIHDKLPGAMNLSNSSSSFLYNDLRVFIFAFVLHVKFCIFVKLYCY